MTKGHSKTARRDRVVVQRQSALTMILVFIPCCFLLTTPMSTASILPDGRVYEPVTPASDQEADVYVSQAIVGLPRADGIQTTLPFQVSAGGDRVAFVGDPTTGGVGSGGAGLGDEYLAVRTSSGGWNQVNIQPPGVITDDYQAFSDELTSAVLAAGNPYLPNEAPLTSNAPSGGYRDLYTQNLTGGFGFQPLSTITPQNRSALEFESANVHHAALIAPELAYAGSSANGKATYFEANAALTASASNSGRTENNLYESIDGHLSLVNVRPKSGLALPDATFGAPPLEAAPFPESQKNPPDLSHAMSSEGNRIFWTAFKTGQLQLYMSEPVGLGFESFELSPNGRFWTASSDGSRAFFTSGELQGELYEYNASSREKVDLTPGLQVIGVLGASEDGNFIYYVESNDTLWVMHHSVGGWEKAKMIARLAAHDGNEIMPFTFPGCGPCGRVGDWQAGLGTRTAEVTPNGESLVFTSERELDSVGHPGGYPNDGLDEVYVYEVGHGEGESLAEGSLFCVSCGPGNKAPEVPEYLQEREAAFVPISWSNTYQPEWVSENGSEVFFDSTVPLVSGDTNGKQDVYEWERDGSGGCGEAGGCVYLLTGGVEPTPSWLIGMSASGGDVFVVSRANLAPGDENEAYHLFDARVGGVVPSVEVACSGSGCQGQPAAQPVFAVPPSETFAGVGNFESSAAPEGESGAKSKGSSKKGSSTKRVSLTRAQKLARALKGCGRLRRGKAREACERKARREYGSSGSGAEKARRVGR